LCKECSTEYAPGAAELRALVLDPAIVQGRKFRRPRGCRACEGSGYRGRIALFEHMEMDPELRELVFRQENQEALRTAAERGGHLSTLLVDGARKVLAGLTSPTEVMRVTRLAADVEV
jgi:type II secretory ATPase GspE/PulE/Tfp pilus assembly ATPase PilB-like protein